MSATVKVALEPINPEAEADALLEQDDLERSMRKEDDDDHDSDFKLRLEDMERSEGSGLPTPVSAGTPAIQKIHPAPIICIWIFLSSSVIIMNAWILKDLDFEFPIFLTTVHMVYATIGTRVLQRFTHLLDGLNNIDMTWDRWLKNIVPIGALFSASLIFSNLAYITLSISFIQMLKAFTSVAVLTMSVLMGLDHFNRRTATVVIAISCGVALASFGEIDFALSGFIFQSSGIMFEATRLVAIQKLLQGMRMDPLVSLYYFAPVCSVINACFIPIFEGQEPFHLVMENVGLVTLFLNSNVAFLLNVAVVFLIGCASSLVLTLSGVVKDILLVAGSVVLFGSVVSITQMVGYSIALGGLVVFKTPPEVLAGYVARFKAAIGR